MNEQEWTHEEADKVIGQLLDRETKLKRQLIAEQEVTQTWFKKSLQLEAQLTAAIEALQMLRDYQNGCPLPSFEKGWNEAMRLTDAALARIREAK